MSELVEMLFFVVFFCGPSAGHVKHSMDTVLFTLSATLYKCRCEGLPSGIASKYLRIKVGVFDEKLRWKPFARRFSTRQIKRFEVNFISSSFAPNSRTPTRTHTPNHRQALYRFMQIMRTARWETCIRKTLFHSWVNRTERTLLCFCRES